MGKKKNRAQAEPVSAPPDRGWPRLRPWLLAVASGVLAFVGYVGFDQFYLQWIFLVPLLWAIRDVTPRRAFLIAWVAGIVGHGGGFYWIAGMLRDFAYVPLALGVVGLVGIAAINALSFGLFGLALRWLQTRRAYSTVWLAPLLWVSIEHAYPFLFPNYLGASQYRVPALTQIADLTGILGVSFFVVWCNSTAFAALEWWLHKRALPRRALLAFGLGTLAVVGYGLLRLAQTDAAMEAAPKLRVALVQTNLGAATKHRDRRGFLRAHQQMSTTLERQHPNLDLIVWPEGAYTGYVARDVARLTSRALGVRHTAMIIGALSYDRSSAERQRYNSVVSIDAHQQIRGMYDKQILVPFGEYIPLGETFPAIYHWSPYSGHFSSGRSLAPLPVGKFLLSANICYEDLFPGLVRDLMLGDGRRAVLPHALINVTNDSWYGNSSEPMEHLVLASFRAIEHRRAMIRSTNTGISAFIDPAGRFIKKSGQWTRETLIAEVPMLEGRTLFSRLGNWFGWGIFLAALLLFGQAGWSERRR